MKIGAMYSTPVPRGIKVPKGRNQIQAPRRTASPWRGATFESLGPDLRSINEKERGATVQKRHADNVQEAGREIQERARGDKPEIVRQTTIVWQDIHPKADCPSLRQQRKKALKAALKSRKDRRGEDDKEFGTKINFAPAARPNAPENVNDVAKRSAFFPLRSHSADLNWARRNKDIKLASISPSVLASKRLEGDVNAKKKPSSSVNTLFVNFAVPSARYGNKTVLPSLHKLV